MKIVLTGGTGFIGGSVLGRLISAGHHVTSLSRRAPQGPALSGVEHLVWDARTQGPWSERVDGADAVIHLAGEPIAAGRWTTERKTILASSRIDSTRSIVEAISRGGKKPAVLISASAVGYYGNVEHGEVDETHARGHGFLPDLCERWEESARLAERVSVRVVMLRIGIVLGKEGGALSKMLLPFKLFVGGPLGSGRQGFSWIHREDVAGIIDYVLSHPGISGPVNVTAPNPVSMNEFCKALGRAMGRPAWLPAPAFALKLMLGELSGLLLDGQRVHPKKLLDAGFRFRHPDLDEAIRAVLKTRV